MARYNVENKQDNSAQYCGAEPHNDARDNWVGDYIDADCGDDAVEQAIAYISKNISNNGYCVETRGDSVMAVDRNGNVIECYYDFTVSVAE